MNLITSPTSITTDWEGGMKYYWSKVEGGSGITPVSEADYFRVGREIHADLASVAEGSTFSEMLARIPPPSPPSQIAMEEWCRRLGWIACVQQFVEPWTRESYINLRIEGPLALTRDPLTIRCIPDRLLEHKVTRKLVYREYKSAKWFSGTWAAH